MMPGGIVVCFSGRMTSGKSSVTQILSEAIMWPRVGFSDYLRALLTTEGAEPTREALQTLGQKLVAEQPEAFCKAVLEMAAFAPGQDLLVDGIRHVDIYERLGDLVAPSRTLLVHLAVDDDDLRARGEARDHDGDGVLKADAHPVEAELKAVLPARADAVVDARLPLPDVVAACLAVLAETLSWKEADATVIRGRAGVLTAPE